MSLTDPPALTVVPPGGGRSGALGSIGVVFKLWGEDTNNNRSNQNPTAVPCRSY